MRAVNKRIAQPVGLPEAVVHTFRANGYIGSHLRNFVRIAPAGGNGKCGIAARALRRRSVDGINGSSRGMFVPDSPDKTFAGFVRRKHGAYDNSAGIIPDLSLHPLLHGKAVYKRPESHSLHQSPDMNNKFAHHCFFRKYKDLSPLQAGGAGRRKRKNRGAKPCPDGDSSGLYG
jgi:hypothetical protein